MMELVGRYWSRTLHSDKVEIRCGGIHRYSRILKVRPCDLILLVQRTGKLNFFIKVHFRFLEHQFSCFVYVVYIRKV
jgi:hypothetical protein